MLNTCFSNSAFSRFRSSTTSHTIRFLLNGKLIELEEGKFDPTDSLVTFLRSDEINMKGTKRGCEEGGCGACTVIMSSYDPVFGRVKHRAINSCLMPIGNLHNTSISTIERLTSSSNSNFNQSKQPSTNLKSKSDDKLNPIQEAIKKHHATQCGFCSPGFIMSTLAMLLENPMPTNEDLMLHLDGNICRCTGYRSILEALREFTVDSEPNDQIISQRIDYNTTNQSNNIQTKKNLNQQIIQSLKSLSDLSSLKQNSKDNTNSSNVSNENGLSKQHVSISYNGHLYSIPSTLDELIQLKKQNPKAKIIVGNTELFASSAPNDKFDYISANMIDELKFIKFDTNKETNNRILRIGAATTIDDVFEFCLKDKTENRILRALKEKISVFASNQTRSVACITGNVAAAGASTDFTNFLPGVDAILKVVDATTNKIRYVKFDNYFLGRFKTILNDSDIITEIFFNIDSLVPQKHQPSPINTDHCFVYKISNRREICGCALSATIRADISENADHPNIINDIKIAFSKLSGANPIGRAKKAESFLQGKEFTLDNVQKAFNFIDQDFPISSELDDGLDTYRRELSHNLLIKFFHQTQKERGKQNEYDESIVNSCYNSTTFSFKNSSNNSTEDFVLSKSHTPELSVSCQCKENGSTVPLSRVSGPDSIGKSVPHLSASLQVQGKAEYTDDITLDRRAKHAAFVTSTISHGRIKRINYQTEELKKRKFTLLTYEDLIEHGNNRLGSTDEEILASSEVVYYGQPIAIVVADSEREAWMIAKMIQVEYEPLPVIVTIDDAIENGKAFNGPSMKTGQNVDEIFKKHENKQGDFRVINGTVKMGGQYHIYMEPNASIASHSSDDQYILNPTTKDLDNARDSAAQNLGIDQNHIYVDVKRLGGAFCSKSLRTSIISTATAICSKKLDCQVKMRLPRDVDTRIMSGDHVFINNYKACFNVKTGKIVALKMDFFVDAGYWYETTAGLAIKAILHADSAYKIPNLEINSHLCQTNKISSAHFRGFGFQNGNLSVEGVFERISKIIQDERENNNNNNNNNGKSVGSFSSANVKEVNFYKTNDRTHYGVLLDDVTIEKCWSLVKEKSRYEDLLKCVRAFNVVSKNKKRGIAITPLQYGVGQPNAARRKGSCLVHLLKDGTVLISHSGVESGQGLNTKLCCLAAKVLEIPVESVRIERTSTEVNTEARSTGAGFTNDLTGFAVIDACQQLKQRIKRFYYYDNKSKKNVIFSSASKPSKLARRPFKEVVNLAYENKEDLTAHGFYASPQKGFDFEKKTGRPYQYYEYGAGVALVEIDILTGEMKLLESHIVFDAGQSLNPGIDIGQIEGGFMQGVGWMTTEETKYILNSVNEKINPLAGKPVNDTMYKYKVPALSSVPLKFSAHLLPDSHNKIGVISSKGVGEPPAILAQCVGFAIIEAIEAGRKQNGKERLSHYDFPLTPDKVKYYFDQQ